MTNEERAALLALAEKATPGKWRVERVDLGPIDAYFEVTARGQVVVQTHAREYGCDIVAPFFAADRDNADFIAASRAAVPALLDALAAAEAGSHALTKAALDQHAKRKQAEAERDALAAQVRAMREALEDIAAEIEREFVGAGEHDLSGRWITRPTLHAIKARAALAAAPSLPEPPAAQAGEDV